MLTNNSNAKQNVIIGLLVVLAVTVGAIALRPAASTSRQAAAAVGATGSFEVTPVREVIAVKDDVAVTEPVEAAPVKDVSVVAKTAPPAISPSVAADTPIEEREYVTADEAWSMIGKVATVRYVVANPFKSKAGNCFLNEKSDYKNGFTSVIFANVSGYFDGDPISVYGYKTVEVTGLVKLYEGHPEIIVNRPNQIRVVK